MAEIKSICIYCGSQNGNNGVFKEAAHKLGQSIAQAEISLVYGGGNSGVMGAISSSVLENGGRVKGIIPRFLLSHEGSHHTHTSNYELTVTENMHDRKRLMFESSDAFLALPGGIGTLEEIVEIMTWAQLGQHNKPIGFLNIDGFWQPMLELMEHMSAAGFIHASKLINPLIIDDPELVVKSFRAGEQG
ncbi:MAG: TIGR00730 family Rossman fold protein [Rhizobiaceae bacterium]